MAAENIWSVFKTITIKVKNRITLGISKICSCFFDYFRRNFLDILKTTKINLSFNFILDFIKFSRVTNRVIQILIDVIEVSRDVFINTIN